MRVLCLLALIGATLPGCCSAHRAWTTANDPCVPQCDSCQAPQHRSCLFRKKSHCRCSHCSSCGTACDMGCGGGECGTNYGSIFGSECGGCSSGAQGQTAYEGAMSPAYSTYSSAPQTTTCPTCHQTQMIPMQTAPSPPMTPPAPPAATPQNPMPMPMPNAPEPSQARLLQPMLQQPARMSTYSMAPQPMQFQQMQPVQMQPIQVPLEQTQPVQYQEWQPHQSAPHTQPVSVPQSFVPYTPPAQQIPQQNQVRTQRQNAVQPVLWVPAQSQAPLLLPAR